MNTPNNNATAQNPSATRMPGQNPSPTTTPKLGQQPGSPVSESIPPPSANGLNAQNNTFPDYSSYQINGINYVVVSLISSYSGEANVYCIEAGGKKYALKLYKYGRHPDPKVLEQVKKASNKFGDKSLLVRLFDYGSWTDPNTGIVYDYERMEYCSGGSLASMVLSDKGDENQFKIIAMQMANAIYFCHTEANLLHNDIKPANFLFTDESHKRLVLTDFGLAKIMNENHEVPNVDIGRTLIYTSPDIYNRIEGTTFPIGQPSDYYALGMSLMALWMGEGKLTAQESVLNELKRNEKLPYPSNKEMSDHTLSLIKKLTVVVPIKRATYEDIQEWSKGKNIFTEGFVVDKDFKPIVFHREKNIIATSPQQLAQIMWENKEEALRYLYNDIVEKWFTDRNWNEIAVSIHEITTKLYPSRDKHIAGLYACCLLLDKNLPLLMDKDTPYDGGPRPMVTQADIAKELFDNVDRYANEGKIKEKNHLLWVYLSQRFSYQQNTIDYFQSAIAEYGVRHICELCYVLDNTVPFRIRLNNSIYKFADFNELFTAIQNRVFNSNNIHILYDNDFVTWLCRKNPLLWDKARKNIEYITEKAKKSETNIGIKLEQPNNTDKGWIIAYSIGFDRGYDFKPIMGDNISKLVTIEDIALQMAQEINEGKQDASTLNAQVIGRKFVHERLYHYLLVRENKDGVHFYDEFLSYWILCTDLHTPNNDKKYGRYNRSIGVMKAIAATLGNFPLHVGKMTLTSLNDFLKNEKQIQNLAQQNGNRMDRVTDWLALQFQEDPRAKLKDGDYYQLTNRYRLFLKEHLPMSAPAISDSAFEDMLNDDKKSYNKAKGRVKLIRALVILLGFIPLALICLTVGYGLIFATDSSIFTDIMEKVGVVFGVISAIWAFFVIQKDELNLIGGAIIAAIVFFIIKWLCVKFTPLVPWVLVIVLILMMIYFGKSIFTGTYFGLYDEWNHHMRMPIESSEERGHIAAAFDSRNKLLPNLPSNYPSCVYAVSADIIKSDIKPLVIKSIAMLVLTFLLIAGLTWGYNKTNPSYSAQSEYAQQGSGDEIYIPDLSGDYSGIFHERKAKMSLKASEGKDGVVNLTGKVTIYYSETMVQKVAGYMKDGYVVLNVLKKNGKPNQRIIYNAQVETNENDNVRLIGHYSNAQKGTDHDFDFIKNN